MSKTANTTYSEYTFHAMNNNRIIILMCSIAVVILVPFIIVINVHFYFFGELYLNILGIIYFIILTFVSIIYSLIYISIFRISCKIHLSNSDIHIYYNGKLKERIQLESINTVDLRKNLHNFFRHFEIIYYGNKKINMHVGEFEKEIVTDFEHFLVDLELVLLSLNFKKEEIESKDYIKYYYSRTELIN